jgi:hypothetical protein
MGKRENDELFKDKIQENVQNILHAEREKMHEPFQGHIQEQVQAQLQQLLAEQGNALELHSPSGHRSSCVFASAIENDDKRYPIENLVESKECRLVMPILGIPRTLAYWLASPLVEGTLLNSHPIPKGYAITLMDRVKPDHHRSKLEYPEENGEWKHGKNIGCHILWCKQDIEFGKEDSEATSSDSSPQQQQTHLPPPLEHQPLSLPPQQQRSLSPPPQQQRPVLRPTQ